MADRMVILSRRRFSQTLAGLGTGWLPGLTAVAGTVSPPPKHGGTLLFVLEQEPTTLVAATTTDNVTKVSAKVTEGLLTYDLQLNPLPQLATAWSISDDKLRYTFMLRRGVKWHDGADFTAADVAFSIRLLQQMHPRGRATFAPVKEIETPDPYTAVLVLSKPAPYLLHAFYADESPILPRHIYGDGNPQSSPNAVAPIGTGPFKFKRWERGSYIEFERNPDYWDRPKPYLDRIICRVVTDAAARTVLFETGEAHLGGEGAVQLSELNRIRALPHIGFETRGFAFYSGVRRLEFNLDNPIFADLKVRQAIAHAIDREALRRTVWYGYGEIVYGPIGPALAEFYNPDLPRYPHDPRKADDLLDQSGHPRGSDGTRFKATLDFRPWTEGDKRTADYLRQALSRVGIDADVRSQDFAAYVKRVYTDRAFDFAANSMTNTFDPTIGVQRLYWSKNFKPGVPFSNASHYINADVDRILETAAVETDAGRRRDEFFKLQSIVAHDLPDINFLTDYHYTLYNKRVFGHTTQATGISSNLADAYLA
jgi:peptide/nickel transport system substrate-binding protein